MKMALIYDPLNDIDLFAGAPRSTMVTCERWKFRPNAH